MPNRLKKAIASLAALSIMLVPTSITSLAEDESALNPDLQIIRSDPSTFDWNSSDAASIDFTNVTGVPTDGLLAGTGLMVDTTLSNNNKSSTTFEDGYMLLGLNARDGNAVGSIGVRLNDAAEDKRQTPYALKIDYYGGGIRTDSGSYIDIWYNCTPATNTKVRKTYGSTYNSGNVESMYFTLENANFSNGIDSKIDFQLQTWGSAQLKIKKITVLAYSPLEIPAAAEVAPADPDTAYTNVSNGQYYNLTCATSANIVKLIDLYNDENYCAVSSTYLGFKVGAASLVKTSPEVTLTISYYDVGTKSFSVEYNAVVPNPLPAGKSENDYNYKSTDAIQMYDTKELVTVSIPIEDAAFSDKQAGGYDFRLRTMYIPEFYVKSVTITPKKDLRVIQSDPSTFDWNSRDAAYIDFTGVTEVSSDGILAGTGLVVDTTASSNNKSSTTFEDGYMLLGLNAKGGNAVGSIGVRLNDAADDKKQTPYALKIDYYGGGIRTDSGSYIDIWYNCTTGTNTKVRNTYGSTHNSGNVETMYYTLSNANFSNGIDGKIDFQLQTWGSAQLKIKKITVVPYSPLEIPAATAVEPSNPDMAYTDVSNGQYYHLIYDTSAKIVKLVEPDGNENYCAVSNTYLGFKVNTASSLKASPDLTLTISYYDVGTTSFSVEYNAAIPDPLPAGKSESDYNYMTTPSIEMHDTKELVTVSIPIEDAAFAGKQTGGYDFRLRTMYIPEFYVKSVTLTKGIVDVTELPPAIQFQPQTALNNFDDKTVVGYQAWFQASDSQTRGWDHWNKGSAPESGKQTFDIYPDVSDYPSSALHQTGYANLLNGQAAVLYDGTSQEAIDTQVQWMQDYGIDGFAVSRFYTGTSITEITGTTKLDYMMQAAEDYGRLFYMGYDMSGIGNDGAKGIKRLMTDFVLNVENKFVQSPNYAQKEGKPVVSLWGFQGSNFARYPDTENALALIQWFQDRGYYVIGGVSDGAWASDTTDYRAVYEAIDMISPWTVGRYRNETVNNYLTVRYTQDKAFIDSFNATNPARPKSYLPTIHPGFSWANWASGAPNLVSRQSGQFMWEQAKLTRQFGFTQAFIAMFDEYDEGTSIAKMAEDSLSIPSDQYFLTAAADGKWLSSDYYLRETAALAKMLRGELPLTDTAPIPDATGPIFWRNGFERRVVPYIGSTATTLANLDVCVPNGSVLTSTGIHAGVNADIIDNASGSGYTTTGENAFQLSGTANPAGGQSQYYYKIANANIEINGHMVLTYNLRPETGLGSYVFVDLLLDNGQKLSDMQGAVKAQRGTAGSWTAVELSIAASLAGRTITGVVIAYDHNASGEFDAYIDDIVIRNAN